MAAAQVSTCILPYLESLNLEQDVELGEADHGADTAQVMQELRAYDQFGWFIELAWLCSTGLGVMLFLADVMLLSWVKFVNHSLWATWAVCMVMGPTSLGFVWFALRFYRRVIKGAASRFKADMAALATLQEQLALAGQSGPAGQRGAAAARPLTDGGGGDDEADDLDAEDDDDSDLLRPAADPRRQAPAQARSHSSHGSVGAHSFSFASIVNTSDDDADNHDAQARQRAAAPASHSTSSSI